MSYRLNDPGSIPDRGRYFLVRYLGSGARPSPLFSGHRGLFPWSKVAELEDEVLSPSSDDIRNQYPSHVHEVVLYFMFPSLFYVSM
jgi:hypothetical protein